ncbi:unnamed protein product [Callosobruchus maculatus]|uniref:Uncharacterized protein n=1 Tax=Callosobruchus maculatus TaxID=64391 RepID=A0A653CSP0_CALMS|nr:unnamed protein product [Callosobruchus maculatus]
MNNQTGVSGIPPPPVPKEENKKSNGKSRHQEPDYEVIEFGQYSNASAVPNTNGSGKSERHCQLCGSSAPSVLCEDCAQIFCLGWSKRSGPLCPPKVTLLPLQCPHRDAIDARAPSDRPLAPALCPTETRGRPTGTRLL